MSMDTNTVVPTKIHGFPIVGFLQTEPNLSVIMVDRGEESHQRWVTAGWRIGEKEWFWGHYFDDRTRAQKDFGDRCAGR